MWLEVCFIVSEEADEDLLLQGAPFSPPPKAALISFHQCLCHAGLDQVINVSSFQWRPN